MLQEAALAREEMAQLSDALAGGAGASMAGSSKAQPSKGAEAAGGSRDGGSLGSAPPAGQPRRTKLQLLEERQKAAEDANIAAARKAALAGPSDGDGVGRKKRARGKQEGGGAEGA